MRSIQYGFILIGFIWMAGAPASFAATPQANKAYHHYLKALIYESQGNLLSAKKEVEKALLIEPESAHLHHMDAEISFFLGQLDRAQEAIEKANQIDPKNTKAHILAGQIYWSLGDVDMAEKKLEKAVTLSPDDSEPLVSLAMAVTARDPKKAIQLYKEFIEKHPGEVEIQERLGQLYRSQGDLKNAKKSWESVLEWSADNLRAHLALAQIAEVNSDTHTAISHYKAVLNKDPTNLPLLLRVGELQYRSNDLTEAYQAFSRAQKISPESPSANFWMALLYEHRGEWLKAVGYLKKVADRSPETGVLLRLSYYYTQAGQHSKAIEILKKLVIMEPENTDFLNYLAIAYEQNKQIAEAIKTLEALIDIDTENAEYRFYIATLYDRMGKFPKAETHLRDAISLKPDYSMALNYLGYSYADRDENLKEAEKLVLRAVELEPKKSAYLDSLGWVYYRLGQYQKAQSFLQAAANTGVDPLIWEHLGDVQMIQGNTSDAILSWDESLHIKSDQPKVKKKMKKALRKLSARERLPLFIKRGMANYTDLKSINGLVEIKVCEKHPCYESRGEFRFQQGELLKIEIPGPFTGPLLMVTKNKGEPTQYGALHPIFQTLEYYVTRAINRLESLLSGDLYRNLDLKSLKNEAQKKGSKLNAKNGTLSLSFGYTEGFLEKVSWTDEGGEEVRLSHYSKESWPLIPQRFEWEDKANRFVIRFQFKDPILSLATDSIDD